MKCVLYFYISIFQSMAVICISLTLCFPSLLLRYCLGDSEIIIIIIIIIITTTTTIKFCYYCYLWPCWMIDLISCRGGGLKERHSLPLLMTWLLDQVSLILLDDLDIVLYSSGKWAVFTDIVHHNLVVKSSWKRGGPL